MTTADLASDLIRDLLRSAWVIERARARLYERWSEADRPQRRSAEAAVRRADLIEERLRALGHEPDDAVVASHAGWMERVVGSDPAEEPLGPLFVARLGDWVDAHAGPFLDEDGERLRAIGEGVKSELTFPDTLPSPPPFEPVEPVAVEAPGDTLFTFAILGDTHIGSPRGERMARAAIDDINRSGAELVIQLGDITDHGERAEFELAKEVLGTIEAPLTTMMGNHDVYSLDEGRLSGREYYSSSFDREPDGLLFEHKGFRFAVLDSIEHGASPFGPFDLVSGRLTDGRGGAIVRGSLTYPQHDLLADVASPGGGPAFVFLHHPPQPFAGFPPILFGLRDEDSGRLHATVDSGNVWGVFAGHTHRNARTRDFDGVPANEVAIPRDFPFGYALVEVAPAGYAFRFHQISDHDLLREAYPSASSIHQRYGLGSEGERGFVWTVPEAGGLPG